MAKPRPSLAIAGFGALALLFAAILVVGLYQGAMPMPSSGFGVSIEQATNPIGFYVAAAFYAALVVFALYPPWLALRHGYDSSPVRARGHLSGGGSGSNLSLEGRVSVSGGRGGDLHVALDHGSHRFWWEFGGGDCLAIVTVPTPDEWPRIPALADYPREVFLDALAREIVRTKCPSASYTIESESILFTT